MLELGRAAGNGAVGHLLQPAPSSAPGRPTVMGDKAPVKAKPASRPPGQDNEVTQLPDGGRIVHDPFDQSLTWVLPDGSGFLQTYEWDEPTAEGGERTAHVTSAQSLTPLR